MTPPEESTDPAECMVCRGTGTLTSGLGGEPHEVRCPWCEGSGRRIADHDAQEHPAEGAPAASAGGDDTADADAG